MRIAITGVPGVGKTTIAKIISQVLGLEFKRLQFTADMLPSDILGVSFEKITIISDDLYGDILPAMKLGMEGVLVLSGKIKREKEITAEPHKIFKNIGEYLGFIKAKRGN